MRVGILGGTGPAGRGVAARVAACGTEVVIGSRDANRAATVAGEVCEQWADRTLAIEGAANDDAAGCDLVVLATPWDSCVATVRPLAGALAGKVVVSMVNALAKEGRELLPLIVPRGSMAATVQAALPASLVSAAFHHLPASELLSPDAVLGADVLVCADHATATAATLELVDAIDGLRGIDAGSLAQAAAVEAFTAVLITVNIRHRVHAAVRLAGFGEG